MVDIYNKKYFIGHPCYLTTCPNNCSMHSNNGQNTVTQNGKYINCLQKNVFSVSRENDWFAALRK